MNNPLVANIFRFLFLVLLQLLIFKQIPIELAGLHVLIFLYPLVIAFLPIQMPRQLLVVIGFLLGITLDIFYDSPGVHAGAAVFTAFIRNIALNIAGIETEQTKATVASIKNIGFRKFALFLAMLTFSHVFVYYVFEVFTFAYFGEIAFKSLGSFVFSYPIMLAYSFIFNPRS